MQLVRPPSWLPASVAVAANALGWSRSRGRPDTRQMSRIFVSYRRADDPFGAGLVAAVLRDRFGDDGVFLDTWVLNRRGNPESGLCRGLDGSAAVVALIGRRWEERLTARDPGATATERD